MKKAILLILIFLFVFLLYSCKESVNQDIVLEKNALQSNNSGSVNSSMIEVSGLQIHEDEPITYKFASIDDFMQKMINKEIQTYKPIKMITVPANDKIIDKINQVIYYYYENIVKYVFEKNDYNLYSITVAMYAPEDYSNEALRRIVFNENEGENQSSYAKVKKIGDSDLSPPGYN